MKYPTITKTKCVELASRRLAGYFPAVDSFVEWSGLGSEVALEPIEDAAVKITEQAREWTDKDRDRFEGRAAIELFDALVHVETDVLDDGGFWRFLALRYFWDFIAWREEGPFSKGNYLKYIDAVTNTEAILPRMYLRAKAVGGSPHGDLAAGIRKGTDFWRSHVLRVRTGSAPPLTRAFAVKQAEARLMTSPLRQAARRLNRTWTNVVLYLYDDHEATDLIASIWEPDSDG